MASFLEFESIELTEFMGSRGARLLTRSGDSCGVEGDVRICIASSNLPAEIGKAGLGVILDRGSRGKALRPDIGRGWSCGRSEHACSFV